MPRISGASRGEGVQAVVFALQILEYLAQHRSTLGVTESIRSRTWAPTSAYFLMLGRMTTASGQSFSALNIGIAERTP